MTYRKSLFITIANTFFVVYYGYLVLTDQRFGICLREFGRGFGASLYSMSKNLLSCGSLDLPFTVHLTASCND